jgi:hypothetical protein
MRSLQSLIRILSSCLGMFLLYLATPAPIAVERLELNQILAEFNHHIESGGSVNAFRNPRNLFSKIGEDVNVQLSTSGEAIIILAVDRDNKRTCLGAPSHLIPARCRGLK